MDLTLAKRARRARRLNTSATVVSAAANLAAALISVDNIDTAVQCLTATYVFLDADDELLVLQRQEALDDAAGLTAAVDVIGQFHESEEVQEAGLTMLSSVRYCAAMPLRTSVAEIVETVVFALRTHGAVRKVVVNGLRALTALARLDDVRNRVLPRVGAIGVVMQCLAEWEEEPLVVIEAARFLTGAAVRCEGNKSDITWNGALGCLAEAVKKRNDGQMIAEWCAAVRNVTVSRRDVVKFVGDMGYVEELLIALKKYGEMERTALHALAALYHLVIEEAINVKRFMQWEGWDEVLCQTARVHFDHWQIQTLVFGIAVVVGGEKEMAALLVDEGMVQIALNAMHRHVTRRGLLHYGAKCVRVLLQTAERGMEQVSQCGGIVRLLDLLYCSVARPITDTAEHCAGYTEVY